MDDKQVIDPQIRQKWDDEYKQYGIKVMPDTAMYYEMETFFPSYAFVVLEPKFTSGRITFFFRDDKPFYPDGSEWHWYEIEPQFVKAALSRIKDFGINAEARDGFEGYVVPLQENSFFGCWEDVNTYLHNLMYWESVMAADENGPLATRMTWLSQKLYAMKSEERTKPNSSLVNETFDKMVAEWTKQSAYDAMNRETIQDYFSRLMEQMYEVNRVSEESRIRQMKLQKEMAELQEQLSRELMLSESRKKNSDTIWELLRKLFDKDDTGDTKAIPASTGK